MFFPQQGENNGEHILILCNAIGSPVDSKVIELEPKHVCLTGIFSKLMGSGKLPPSTYLGILTMQQLGANSRLV